jgi:glycosidase
MSKIKKPLYIIFCVVFTLSCGQQKATINDDEILYELASPITINSEDSTTILLQDYFIKPETVDSVSKPIGYKIYRDKKAGIVSLLAESKSSSNPGNIRFWVNGKSFDIPTKNRYKKSINFTFKNSEALDSVQLTGDFNGWTPHKNPLKKSGNIFSCDLNLTPGQYGYQLVKNGKWGLDENNPLKISNGQGGFNSVIKVEDLNPNLVPKIFTATGSDKTFSIIITGAGKLQMATYLNNHLLEEKEIKETPYSKVYIFEIPEVAKSQKRSHIRVFCNNEFTSGNDLLIPLQNGKIITDPSLLTRSDFESNILYFMMVDRFNNGTTANDYKMDTNLVKPKAQYYGGDIKGILAKLKEGYFKNLGINAIWISPITQNPLGAWGQFKDPDTKFSAYHGYWPTTLTTVDFRFGTEADVKELLEEAHKQNINVFLDYVAHHLHIEHPIIKKNPTWVTPLYLPDGTMNTERWDDYRLTTWFDTFMPTLNLSDQKVTDYMVDSALHWVRDVPFDGFRHDATKHIPLNFWRTLTKKIKTEVEIPRKQHIYQIGETYGNNELISSYVNTGMLDAQFDFNLYDALLPVFTAENESFKRVSSALKQSFSYYGFHHLMGNITGNQDKPRFISYADGSINSSIPWQETKRMGWKKNIQVKDTLAYKKLAAAHAFNLTIPGVPIIYYGDEFGMPGANDPDNRRMMKFSGLSNNETWLKETTTKLAEMRKNSMALMYGDFQELRVDDNIFAYSRNYFGETVWVIFNKGKTTTTFQNERLAGKETVLFGNQPSNKTKALSIDIEPWSFAIIKWNN